MHLFVHRTTSLLLAAIQRCSDAEEMCCCSALRAGVCVLNLLLLKCVCLMCSYRRGKPETGDIDFTIMPPRALDGPTKPLLHKILRRLLEIVRPHTSSYVLHFACDQQSGLLHLRPQPDKRLAAVPAHTLCPNIAFTSTSGRCFYFRLRVLSRFDRMEDVC